MEETAQTTNASRINRVTIGRLHNLGDYEHIRYEISVDVLPSDNPSAIVTQLETILNDLQASSGVSSSSLRTAREALATPASELSEWDAAHLQEYKERVRKVEEAHAKRVAAKESLFQLHGAAVFTDAKTEWDDDEPW